MTEKHMYISLNIQMMGWLAATAALLQGVGSNSHRSPWILRDLVISCRDNLLLWKLFVVSLQFLLLLCHLFSQMSWMVEHCRYFFSMKMFLFSTSFRQWWNRHQTLHRPSSMPWEHSPIDYKVTRCLHQNFSHNLQYTRNQASASYSVSLYLLVLYIGFVSISSVITCIYTVVQDSCIEISYNICICNKVLIAVLISLINFLHNIDESILCL